MNDGDRRGARWRGGIGGAGGLVTYIIGCETEWNGRILPSIVVRLLSYSKISNTIQKDNKDEFDEKGEKQRRDKGHTSWTVLVGGNQNQQVVRVHHVRWFRRYIPFEK